MQLCNPRSELCETELWEASLGASPTLFRSCFYAQTLAPCLRRHLCRRYACAWPCILLNLTLTPLPWLPGLTLDLLPACLLITGLWPTLVIVTGPAPLYLLRYCGNAHLVNEETARLPCCDPQPLAHLPLQRRLLLLLPDTRLLPMDTKVQE